MAMMISKFHRLIQNKMMWWFIIVIIVFSFVIWGSQINTGNEQAQKQSAAATLAGAPIQQSEYRMAYASTHLSYVLQSGRQIDVNPKIEEILRKQAWQRIAVLREAASLGIVANDQELLPFIHQTYSVFRTREGQFNGQMFQQVLQQLLPKFGFSSAGFDQFVRDEIIIQKIGTTVVRSMLVSPSEARRMYQSMNDTFVAQYAMLTPDLVEKTVKVGTAEARALFDKDPKAYTVPEKAVVNYVAITYSNFLTLAEATSNDVQKYYNDHLDEFTIPTTNTAANTNEFATEAVRYKSLEDVRPQIVSAVKDLSAARLAASNALAFVNAMQGSVAAPALPFDKAAVAAGLAVSTTRPFAENEEVPGLDVGPNFNRSAFSLVNEEGGNVSEPVEAPHAIYILAYSNRIAERVPTFDEVATNALADARNQAISDALTALAKKTRDAMDAAAKAGKPVADAALILGVKLVTSPPFAASGDNEGIRHFNTLIRTVLIHNAGEVADLVPTDEGILVAHVAQRIPADTTVFEQNRPMIANQIRRAHGRQLFEGWQEYLLKRDKFEDLYKKAAAGDEG